MSTLGIPSDIPKELKPIAVEVHRIHESTLWSAANQFETAKQWRLINVLLGAPAAIAAAVSGGTGLTSSSHVLRNSVLALIAAGLGAALTVLNPSKRSSSAQSSANAYLELQTTARQLLTIDLKETTYIKAREELANISARRDEINRISEPPNRLARWLAKKSIESGGQTYEIDKN